MKTKTHSRVSERRRTLTDDLQRRAQQGEIQLTTTGRSQTKWTWLAVSMESGTRRELDTDDRRPRIWPDHEGESEQQWKCFPSLAEMREVLSNAVESKAAQKFGPVRQCLTGFHSSTNGVPQVQRTTSEVSFLSLAEVREGIVVDCSGKQSICESFPLRKCLNGFHSNDPMESRRCNVRCGAKRPNNGILSRILLNTKLGA